MQCLASSGFLCKFKTKKYIKEKNYIPQKINNDKRRKYEASKDIIGFIYLHSAKSYMIKGR